MKKNVFLAIFLGLFLAGCGTAQTTNSIVERSGEIKTKVGTEYLLNTNDGIVNITSTKINLDNYLKKQVKVKGMFSGSTLYVDEIN